MAAALPDGDGHPRPLIDVLAETLELARPVAAKIGCLEQLEGIEVLVAEGGGASAQRSDFERGGITAVLKGLLERTLEGLGDSRTSTAPGRVDVDSRCG